MTKLFANGGDPDQIAASDLGLHCLPIIISLVSDYNGLTLKTPRKPATENVVCLCRLMNILANF